jgi:predicted ATPase
VSRSANREAVAFFEQALRILGEMPQDAQARHQELEIRIALGPALSDFKGPTSAEVEKCYARALELVDQLGAAAHRFPVLWGLWFLYFNRGQSAIAVQAGERLLASAQEGDDSGQLLEGHHALWPTLTAMGRPVQATFHAEQGLALYDRERHSGYALLYAGHDPGACCRWSLGYLRWLCGYPEQAVGFVKDALNLVEELKHPSTTVFALWFAAWVHYQRGEHQLAGNLFERLIGVAQAHGLDRRTGEVAVVLRMIRNNRVEPDDIAQLEREVRGVQSSTWRQNFMMCALAEQCMRQGLIEQGSAVLHSVAESNRSSFMAPEFLRLEGELLQMEERRPAEEAERRLRKAVELARGREEKGFELRAATGLARLLASAGRREEARAALSGIYSGFSEGFGTADLVAARALLQELGVAPVR